MPRAAHVPFLASLAEMDARLHELEGVLTDDPEASLDAIRRLRSDVSEGSSANYWSTAASVRAS